jgi:plastocyanin
MRYLMPVALAIVTLAVPWRAPELARASASPSYPPSSAEARTAPVTIGVYDHHFEVPTIRISPGTTIRWLNRGKQRHTITSVNGLFDSEDLLPGASHLEVFEHPGVYGYYCRYHMKDGMRGTIVVGYTSSR